MQGSPNPEFSAYLLADTQQIVTTGFLLYNSVFLSGSRS